MPTYFNIIHRREVHSAPLPCRTAGCRGNPINLELCDARALLEYRLRDDAAAQFHASCKTCGKDSTYAYSDLLNMTPQELRPVPLPQDYAWAVVLKELPTADEMQQRAFLGEKILTKVIAEGARAWTGNLISESSLAIDLAIGERIGGPVINAHRWCTGVLRNNKIVPFSIGQLSQGLDVAAFFLAQTGQTHFLQCANLSCSNPSCAHYFSFTYSQFQDSLQTTGTFARAHGEGTTGFLIIKCELCQTSRVVDERSYEGLFKV